MKKTLVLYQSKYGATKRYAEMLRQELSCDIFPLADFQLDTAENYGTIVFAGGIYASGISCMKFIHKNLPVLSGKRLAVFAVGASPFDEKAFAAVQQHNLKNLPFAIPMFYGRGAYDESIMTRKDRALCRLLKKALRKKDPANFEPWMEAFLEADGKHCDWTDTSYLRPLLAYLQK